MPLHVPDVGKLRLMDHIRNFYNTSALHYRLFKNNYTPVDSSTLGNFVESDFANYSEIIVSPWSTPFMAAGRAMSQAPTCVWTMGAPGTTNDVYGYYAVDALLNEVVWAERFPDAPRPMQLAGQQIVVNPALTDKSEY